MTARRDVKYGSAYAHDRRGQCHSSKYNISPSHALCTALCYACASIYREVCVCAVYVCLIRAIDEKKKGNLYTSTYAIMRRSSSHRNATSSSLQVCVFIITHIRIHKRENDPRVKLNVTLLFLVYCTHYIYLSIHHISI